VGWNDHVEMVEMQCLDCGAVATWECWNEVAKARYGGALGQKLGHDIRKSDCCPDCGSSKGRPVPEDEWD
jgi:hypothetical protein